jgi:glutamate--cysteine ligase
MIEKVAKKLKEKGKEVEEWFNKQKENAVLPIYSSFDIRNAGYKAAVVDSNAFPSGFNNICPESYPFASKAIRSFVDKNFSNIKKVGIVAELTTNPYYYDHIAVLKRLFENAGYSVHIGTLETTKENKVSSFSMGEISIDQFQKMGKKLFLENFTPELLILNDDLSSSDTSLLRETEQFIAPKLELGWFQRKKHNHFRIKNKLVLEVSKLLGIDRWQIGSYFEFVDGVDFKEKKNFDEIAEKIDICIKQIQGKYDEYGIKDEPFVFVKGSSSTYGMNVIPFHSGDEFLRISSRQRSKMRKSKGGKEVTEVMIQEGVVTKDKVEGKIAEPVVYCIGDSAIGGFFRAHGERTEKESLSAKGMFFSSDLFCPTVRKELLKFKENAVLFEKICVYKFLARLGVLAIGKELEELR